MHRSQPPPSTYIGAQARRIDFIFGCERIATSCVRSGALAYSEGPQSDHRGLFVDLEINELCQSLTPQKMSIPTARFLHTKNPELVLSYITHMKEYYTSHNMFACMQSIVDQQNSLSNDTLRSLLIKWDNDQGRAMAFAKRQLIVPPKKCDWSPQLRNAAIIRLCWKLRLREHTRSHNYSPTFLRWQAKLQRSDPTFSFPHLNDTLSATLIRRYFNKATSTFRKCQRSAHDLRMLSYDDLLDRYEQDENPLTSAESKSKAKIVRRTIQTESTRSVLANLRHQLKPSDFSQLSKILIPRHKDSPPTPIGSDFHQILEDNDPTDLIWDTVVSKEDMEKHLLNFNREAFRAASSSQCGNGRIFEALTVTSLSATRGK